MSCRLGRDMLGSKILLVAGPDALPMPQEACNNNTSLANMVATSSILLPRTSSTIDSSSINSTLLQVCPYVVQACVTCRPAVSQRLLDNRFNEIKLSYICREPVIGDVNLGSQRSNMACRVMSIIGSPQSTTLNRCKPNMVSCASNMKSPTHD